MRVDEPHHFLADDIVNMDHEQDSEGGPCDATKPLLEVVDGDVPLQVFCVMSQDGGGVEVVDLEDDQTPPSQGLRP